MKKKALALFLAALLIASTVACGDSKKNSGNDLGTDSGENNQNPETPGGNQNPGGEGSGNQGDIEGSENEGSSSGTDKPVPNDKAGITLTSGDTCTLKVDQTHQIVALFVPEFEGDSTALTYTVTEGNTVSVSETGCITALAVGNATVTVSGGNGKYTASVTVTVIAKDLPPVGDDPIPDRTQYLTVFESAIYKGNLVLVNLKNKLHFSEPDDLLNIKKESGSEHLLVSVFKHQLTKEALDALAKMADDYYSALSEGSDKAPKNLLVSDAYHTNDEQQDLFDNKHDIAPAGYSDLQTGLSFTVKFFDGTFTYTVGNHQAEAETAWLMQHYAEYGFILRYPDGKKDQTGYDANNAYFRYVGIPHAQYIKENNLTLEEYLTLLQQTSMEKPLQMVAGGQKYSVYHVASQGESSTVPVPGFTTTVDYSISGNNLGGFIVTVNAHWKENDFDSTLPTPNPDAGITLDKTEAELTVDDTLQLIATFVPLYDTDDTTLIYTSSNSKIAAVDQSGRITALKAGNVTITVKNAEGDFTATCTVTVNAKAPVINPDAGITLNKTELALKTGDTFQLIATYIPEFETDNTMLIYSASGSAVTVSGMGNVFAKEVGSAVITVKSIDGKYSTTCTVTVTKGMNLDASLTLEQTEISLEEGSSTQLHAIFIPKYDTDSTTLYYQSSANSVATVDENGVITAVKEGTAVITVQNVDGEYTATCTVTVTYKPPVADPDAGIYLDKTELTLSIGDSYTLQVTFKTEFPDDSTMISFSPSSSIISVNGLGKITALKPGVATVTVKSLDGKFKTTCTVLIPDPDAGLTVDKSEITMNEGQIDKITATLIPLFPADDTTLFFDSSDNDIVSVDEAGKLTAHKHGDAVITVTNSDGTLRAQCSVTVIEVADPNAGITLDKTEITLETESSDRITATFIPVYDADDTTLSFESSDDTTVSVDASGNITALKPGNVTITVKNADGSFEATCKVKVTEKANENAGITLDKTEITLMEGETDTISATFIPKYPSDDTTLSYESSDDPTVSVDASGKLTAHKPGSVTITVKNADGSFEATCTVKVTEKANENAGITLDKTEITMDKGASVLLGATYIPEYSTDDTTLSYESSDDTTVSVDASGMLTAHKPGSVTITVKNANGSFEASCSVTVNDVADPNAGITLDQNEITLMEGETGKIVATFTPAFENDDTGLNFISTNDLIVKVDENGNLTAISAGSATIIVANGGGKYVANCIVTVTKKPNENAGITLGADSVTAEVDGTTHIVATFIPLYQGDDTTLIFTVEDSDIATVDPSGLVTGICAGKTTVTVRNQDGTYSASCTVIITLPIPSNPNAGISLEKNKITLHLTNSPTATIVATVIPEHEGDDTTLTYVSSDDSIVSVDQSGNLTAKKAGSVTITITCGNLSATCQVTATNLLVGEDNDSGYGDFIPYDPQS